MKKIYKKLVLILLIILATNVVFSQTNEIAIKFIGNCGLYLTDGDLNIYIDFPYKSGAHNYMEYDASELENISDNPIFIFTHKHSDHYSKRLLKKRNGKIYTPSNVRKLEELNNSQNEFSIQAIKTNHVFNVKHYSYLITWHSKKIFISGDTEKADSIGKLKDLDWVFIPAWLAQDALERDIKIDTKKIGIYHIGPKDKINISGERVLMLDKQGEVIVLPY